MKRPAFLGISEDAALVTIGTGSAAATVISVYKRPPCGCRGKWGEHVEGRVPAADIWKLLNEGPRALRLAVPGMPAGAPGMDAPHAGGYDVLLFQGDGATQVYHACPQT